MGLDETELAGVLPVISHKGKLLIKLSQFWFDFLHDDIKNHLVDITAGKTVFDYLPKELSQDKYKIQIEDRSLLIKRVSKKPPESIFTPSTKTAQGERDENISVEQAEELVGQELCREIDVKARQLYDKCVEYAKSRGIIIADTKVEFGLDSNNELVLVNEMLTPESSRFWNLLNYVIGKEQDSYDKQFFRNWLTSNELAGVENVTIPKDIVEKKRAKYIKYL